jgi:hypothetical protein
MGYPGDGVHSSYRNKVEDVARFLNEYHGGHYKVFNVSEEKYEPQTMYKLGGTEYNLFLGWPDHHSPSLQRLIEVVLLMDQWLIQHPQNVAVIHCQVSACNILCFKILFYSH